MYVWFAKRQKGGGGLNSQSRFKLAISHEEPDRVPLDLGGIVSGITQTARRQFSFYLGLSSPKTLVDRSQRLAKPNPEILSQFGIDTKQLTSRFPLKILWPCMRKP